MLDGREWLIDFVYALYDNLPALFFTTLSFKLPFFFLPFVARFLSIALSYLVCFACLSRVQRPLGGPRSSAAPRAPVGLRDPPRSPHVAAPHPSAPGGRRRPQLRRALRKAGRPMRGSTGNCSTCTCVGVWGLKIVIWLRKFWRK